MRPERKHNELLSRRQQRPPFFQGELSFYDKHFSAMPPCLGALGHFNETVLSSRLFLRLMHYRPFLGLAGSSLLCAAAPQIVISLWPWHKGPFAGLCAGARGSGKLIQQPELGAAWESFCLGSWAGSLEEQDRELHSGEHPFTCLGSCFWGDLLPGCGWRKILEGRRGACSGTAWLD